MKRKSRAILSSFLCITSLLFIADTIFTNQVSAEVPPVTLEVESHISFPVKPEEHDKAFLFHKGVRQALTNLLYIGFQKVSDDTVSPASLQALATKLKQPEKHGFIHTYKVLKHLYDPVTQVYSLSLIGQVFRSKLLEALNDKGISTNSHKTESVFKRILFKAQLHFIHLPEQSRLVASLITEELDRSGISYFFDNSSEKENTTAVKHEEANTGALEANLPHLNNSVIDEGFNSGEEEEKFANSDTDMLMAHQKNAVQRSRFSQTVELNYVLNLTNENRVLQFFLSEKIFGKNGSLLKGETFSGQVDVQTDEEDSLFNGTVQLTRQAVAKMLESLPQEKETEELPLLPPS